jgi:hypothetical protein
MIHQFQCLACKGRYADTMPDGSFYAHACGPRPVAKKQPAGERPDKRDENLAVNQSGRVVGIKSAGAGVKCLTDGRLEEPPWISALHKRIAAEEEKANA